MNNMQLSIFIGSGIVNALISLFLALFVLWKKRDEIVKKDILFILMNFFIFFWAGSYVLWLYSKSSYGALIWVKLLSIGSIFIALFYAHWITLLLDIKKLPRIIKFGYLYSVFIIFIIFSQWFIRDMGQKFFFPYWPNASWGFFFYILMYIFYPTYGIGLLYKRYKFLKKSEERSRIKYVFYGSIIGFGAGAFNFPLWVNMPIIPYTNWLVAPYAIVLGLAMLRYSLLEIKTFLFEVLGILLILLSFYNLFFFVSFLDLALRVILLILVGIAIFLLTDSIHKEKLRSEEIQILNVQLQDSMQKEKARSEEIETLNSQLNKSMNELKKIDELKTEFVSLASHQLRTPLTPIKGFSDMLLEGSVGSGVVADEDQRNAIKMINESANRMDNLIDDILDVSKLEKEGGFTYTFETLNPEEVIKKVVDDFTKQAKDKGLELSFTSSLSPSAEVKLDPSKFTDAIGNLLSNSVKYTLKGSITVTLTEDEKDIIISVKDTGVGIEKEDMPRLFQKFYRGKEMARLDAMGTGLGLYFTRHVIEDHGGHIAVQSEGPGKGSEFTVKLPKATNDLQPTTNDT